MRLVAILVYLQRPGYPLIPVVMIADLMAEGDHDGYTLFTRAAIPVTCGHAMEVPDRMLKCISFLAGDHAAKMFSPGAAMSGYKKCTHGEEI
jgi:hypothetical protein